MNFETWKPRIQGLSLDKEIKRWILVSRIKKAFDPVEVSRELKGASTRSELAQLFIKQANSKDINVSHDEVNELLGLLECKETMENLAYPNPSLSEFSLIEKIYIVIGYLSGLVSRELKSGLRLLFRSSKKKIANPVETIQMSGEEFEASVSKLSRPKNELWRLHIDWEHQMYGPETYEEGYHSTNKRHRERGYLNGCVNAHEEMILHVGEPIDLQLFTEVNRLLLTPHRPHRNVYALEYAQVTRIKHTTDEPFIKDLDKKYVRKHPFARWEVYVFGKFLRKKDFMYKHYPYLANYFNYKYGDDFKLTKRMLNDEMYRYHVSFTEFRWFNRRRHHEKGIIDNLQEVSIDMEKLREERKRILEENSIDQENKLFDLSRRQLLRIAVFQKWIEYLHAFSDGTSRQGCMLANKVLVEYGFSPSVSCFRHDSRFYTDEIWAANMCEGMSRWEMIALFSEMGILEEVLRLVGNETVKVEKSKE